MTRRSPVAALAITQTIGYGTLYYAFAVFLTPVAADLHTSATTITGAFTANVLAGAACAVPVGRWLDRHGGRALLTLGSLAGTMLLVAWANVHTIGQLYAVQIGIGVAGAASLYEAAFAVVVAWTTPERRSGALLAVTVVAGFAGTIFLPLSGWLLQAYGWRTALLVLAAVQAVTVVLHALVIRPAPGPVAQRPERSADRRAVRAVLTDRSFWLLTLGFTAHTAALSALTVHLVAALVAWGHSPAFAATVAGLLGVLSVTGRLITTGLQHWFTATAVTASVFALQGVAAAALPLVGAMTAGAVLAVAGFGLGFGVGTIARPVILAQRYDTRRFATLAGVLVVPMTVAKATAPLVAAAVHGGTGGYGAVLVGVALCCGIAAAAIGPAARGKGMDDGWPGRASGATMG